jgi:recombination protein RecA
MTQSKFLQFGSSLEEQLEKVKEFISTGSTTANLALGGGIAKGRIINIIGEESNYKTYLALAIVKSFLRKYKNGFATFDDIEASLDAFWVCDVFEIEKERFRVLDVNNCSETVEDLESNVKLACSIASDEQRPVIYVCDSLDPLFTERTRDGGTKKKKGGEEGERDFSMRDNLDKPMVLSRVFATLNREIKKSDVTLILISQLRAKLDVMFGEKTDVTGGRALKHYSIQRIKMAAIGKIIENKKIVGQNIKLKVVKNKIARPFKEAFFPVYYNYGIDDIESCIDYIRNNSQEFGIGKSFKYNNMSFQSKKKLQEFIESNIDYIKYVRKLTKDLWNKIEGG